MKFGRLNRIVRRETELMSAVGRRAVQTCGMDVGFGEGVDELADRSTELHELRYWYDVNRGGLLVDAGD